MLLMYAFVQMWDKFGGVFLMERTMSVEEKIRRAEEIYNRRKGGIEYENKTQKLHVSEPQKDVKLLRKMIIQIIICAMIYGVFYIIQNNQFIFSEDFLNKTKEVLSYDTNFVEIYENIKDSINSLNQGIFQKTEKTNTLEQQSQEESVEQNAQGNDENTETKAEESSESTENQNSGIGGAVEENQTSQVTELSQEEQDINNVKNTTTFIKPIEGKVSSKFGYRDTATGAVPKNHTGTDIASNMGTKIKSATDGEVVLASEEGDYGKHLKIQIGEVAIIYAHCNQLYVKQGDHIVQGQEIAEVGSTGNSTGPHLHFEIRYQERIVDPQKILEI